MPKHYDIIVAGAGIIGASIAYHLAKKGKRVAILDKIGPFAAASGASDGAVSVCTKRKGVMSELSLQSLRYYNELSKPGQVLEGFFKKRPSYYFSTTEAENSALDILENRIRELGPDVSVASDQYRPCGIPNMGENISRVLEVSGEGHVLAYKVIDAFIRSQKMDRLWPCELVDYSYNNDIVEIKTSMGKFSADHLVVATGVDATTIFPSLPISRRSGQLIVTERIFNKKNILQGSLTAAAYLLNKNQKECSQNAPPIVIDPLTTGQYLIGSTRENDGDQLQTDFATVQRLLTHAVKCFPPLRQERIIRVFAGVRASVIDSLPILGSIDATGKVIVATGFEGDGICLSPLIGREVTNFIFDKTFSPSLSVLNPERFSHKTVKR